MEELETKLRKRAQKARSLAQAGIAVIILIVITIITAMFMFFKSPEVSVSPLTPSSIQFSDKSIETIGDLKGIVDELKTEIKNISSQKTSVMGDFETIYLINALTLSFIRVGAVILAIFLTQVLVNFTRYQFRIADHLDAVADATTLSNGDYQQLITFVGAISPQHIDFGKQVDSPSDKIVEVLKTAIEKIPNDGK